MPENELQHETSPYLLQHKENPVHWMAWGDPAFIRAKAENKPILLSVSYAACHWCRVMAHDIPSTKCGWRPISRKCSTTVQS